MPGGLGAFALVVAAAVIALVLLLVWLLARNTGRTSFGFYVERKPFEDEFPFELGASPEKVTEEQEWPKRKEES